MYIFYTQFNAHLRYAMNYTIAIADVFATLSIFFHHGSFTCWCLSCWLCQSEINNVASILFLLSSEHDRCEYYYHCAHNATLCHVQRWHRIASNYAYAIICSIWYQRKYQCTNSQHWCCYQIRIISVVSWSRIHSKVNTGQHVLLAPHLYSTWIITGI